MAKDLIDRQEAVNEMCKYCGSVFPACDGACRAKEYIALEAPMVDAAPVRREDGRRYGLKRPENLKQLIDAIECEKCKKSLSDGWLKENGSLTREDAGIGEYQYGIVMVPEDWVLPYLKRLLALSEQR